MQRPAFKVTGYTLLVPPRSDEMIPQFWRQITADGRLELLKNASSNPPWILGLGSWDPECEKHGQRYTICIEATEYTDFTPLAEKYSLFTKEIGASDWMCYQTTQKIYDERFWKDNPYKMMKKLGYLFNGADFSVGLHFDAYPPDFDNESNPAMEFWITVKKKL
jgi:predicted transcriptional regulator YdeE